MTTLYTLLLTLLLVGVVEAKEPTREGIPVNGSAPDINYGIVKPISPKKVVIPYDDFLKIIASKEHSDNLKNQCAAERAILVKLKDEQGKTISIQADQVKGLIETAEMQEKLGATESQINEALQVQLAKLTGDLDREKRLSRYKSEAVWVGVIVALGLWVVN